MPDAPSSQVSSATDAQALGVVLANDPDWMALLKQGLGLPLADADANSPDCIAGYQRLKSAFKELQLNVQSNSEETKASFEKLETHIDLQAEETKASFQKLETRVEGTEALTQQLQAKVRRLSDYFAGEANNRDVFTYIASYSPANMPTVSYSERQVKNNRTLFEILGYSVVIDGTLDAYKIETIQKLLGNTRFRHRDMGHRDIIVLFGNTGSGKTTLMKSIFKAIAAQVECKIAVAREMAPSKSPQALLEKPAALTSSAVDEIFEMRTTAATAFNKTSSRSVMLLQLSNTNDGEYSNPSTLFGFDFYGDEERSGTPRSKSSAAEISSNLIYSRDVLKNWIDGKPYEKITVHGGPGAHLKTALMKTRGQIQLRVHVILTLDLRDTPDVLKKLVASLDLWRELTKNAVL